MTYNFFKEQLIEQVKSAVCEDTLVSIETVRKNNDQAKDAIIIKEADKNIAPTIYLEGYYEMFNSGKPMECVVEEIIDCYKRCRPKNDFELKTITDYESVKDKIIFRLVSLHSNEDILHKIPHMPYLDMMIEFAIYFSSGNFANGTITINNDLVEKWGVDIAELYERAMINSPKLLKPTVRDVADVIPNYQWLSEIEFDGRNMLYVVSNHEQVYGASVILYKNLIQSLAEVFNSDLLIIPSSVHEVLILRCDDCKSLEEVSEFVAQVNREAVDAEDVLSDHAYYYSRMRRAICY